jgi:hypothetical protein
MTGQSQQSANDQTTTKKGADDNGTINRDNMTSIAESEMEALPLEENRAETDNNLWENGKRGRNSEDLTGSPNRHSPELPKPGNDATDDDNYSDLNLIHLEEKFSAEKEIWAHFDDEYG